VPLNDYEWLELTFYVKYLHYYELPLSNYLLLIYWRVCSHYSITHLTSGECGKCSSKPCSAEYLESVEKLWIFFRRYIVGTLTNKANIII